jgi:diadenosine tetraphosphate (Ap4A) HIT family hydrolase
VDDSPFLRVPRSVWVASNEHAFAVRDAYPVTPGHTLVVPHRLVPDMWSLEAAERHGLLDLVDVVVRRLRSELDPPPDGFTIGINDGEAAGQTVLHLHVHVIPRHHGDVAEPVGGVRHVIPGKGNYLQAQPAKHQEDSPMEESAFLQRVLALLHEGRKVATYKPALLLALIDACARRGVTGPEPITIPVTELAELVIESYWPQVRPYGDDLPEQWYRLRQATGERPQKPGSTHGQARIPRAVHRLRHAASPHGWTSPAQVRLGDPGAWQQTVRTVAEALTKQPIPRLQRPGTWTAAATYTSFLYNDSDFGEHVTAAQALTMSLTLRPGVAAALVRAAPLLRPAVEGAWTSMVADLNQLSRVEQALHGFLFGATRTNLGPVLTALLDLGVRDCFWCGTRLRSDVHVDHVLPWAHFPNDALFNLVLADQGCNLAKRDVLVGPALLGRWVDRPLDALQRASEDLLWPVDRQQSLRTAVAAYTWVPAGVPLWEGAGRLVPSTAYGRRQALAALGQET